jgi:hypothetical protein
MKTPLAIAILTRTLDQRSKVLVKISQYNINPRDSVLLNDKDKN